MKTRKTTYRALIPTGLLAETIQMWIRVVGQCRSGYVRVHGIGADVYGMTPDGEFLVKIRPGPKNLRCPDYHFSQQALEEFDKLLDAQPV